MYLQGNLQMVFDALYELGVIDPVLEMDWGAANQSAAKEQARLDEVVKLINQWNGDLAGMVGVLKRFDETTLSYLAIEVARELADFNGRGTLH